MARLASYEIPADTPAMASTPSSQPTLARNQPATTPPVETAEHEPNNTPDQANRLSLPARVTGAIDGGTAGRTDADCFRFAARAGDEWVFEIDAARSQSKLDSHLEVFDAHGQRVPRVLLQAVRDSYFTFRGKNDGDTDDFRLFNWEEMRINDYLYANGEVVKFSLFPRGPDSGFEPTQARGPAGAISTRPPWPTRSASRATS